MNITLKIKGLGEQVLFLQPAEPGIMESNDYILIRCLSDIESPIMKLHLAGSRFTVLEKKELEENEIFLEFKLNTLAINLVEAIQQGVDISAESIPDTVTQDKPYNPELIRVDSSGMSLRQVHDMIRDNDINLSPDFQRSVVWDSQRKSRLIESILLRIPLPVFYFSADDRGQLSVVDGLQRLTAINEFMSNRLPLHGLEYLTDLEGCRYNEGSHCLDDKLYRRFNLTQITTNVIDASSPTRVKYDIFRRLNTGGRPLNAQELRNCLSSPQLRCILRQMSQSSEFKTATTDSISDTRMEAQEYALRFLYFRFLMLNHPRGVEGYSGAMDNDLDEFVDFLSKEKDFPFDDYLKAFYTSMNNASYLFGRHAFRKVHVETQYDGERSVINKALFISWSMVLSELDTDYVKSEFAKYSWIPLLGKEISTDEDFLRMLTFGTNGWKNIIYSFEKVRGIVNALTQK